MTIRKAGRMAVAWLFTARVTSCAPGDKETRDAGRWHSACGATLARVALLLAFFLCGGNAAADTPLDATRGHGETRLHRAVRDNDRETVAALLQGGADVNVRSAVGWTPLHFALVADAEGDDRHELAMMLIERGADVNAATAVAGWTPLHFAVLHRDEPEIVAALVRRGANVNAQTRFGGWTPLRLTLVWDRSDETAAMLRAAGGKNRKFALTLAEFPRVLRGGFDLPHRSELERNVEMEFQGRKFGGIYRRREVERFVVEREMAQFYPKPESLLPAGELSGYAVPGSFTEAGADERLVFEAYGSFLDDTDGYLAHLAGLIDKDGAVRILWNSDEGFSFRALCSDPVTGLDHAMFYRNPGGRSPTPVVSMYYDAAGGTLVEGFSDQADPDFHEYVTPAMQEVAPRTSASGRAADGTCRWRNKKEAHDTLESAMSALRVGKSPDLGDGALPRTFALPVRTLPAVHGWLTALDGIAAFEGAVYADRAARESWFIVQVMGATPQNREGVVLLLDRREGTWRTIYDVAEGNYMIDNFYMRGMVVEGDRLFAGMCTSCEGQGWAGYSALVIDLRTHRATVLRDAPSALEGDEEENPPIGDIHAALSANLEGVRR